MKKIFLGSLAGILIVTLFVSSCSTRPENVIRREDNQKPYPTYESMDEEACDAATETQAPSEKKKLNPFQALKSSRDRQSNEEYDDSMESPFCDPQDKPLSTFSIDVDTASYSNIRRYLNDGQLPPKDAVRVEECINYFTYDYEEPRGKHPIAVNVTMSQCPWNEGNLLAQIALQGRKLNLDHTPPSNLVFLLDVSGSMNDPDKLPLVVSAIKMLVKELDEEDTVSIVVYAGAAGVILEGASGSNDKKIERALDRLSAGGSTAGGEGIHLAYRIARDYFIENGNNRIVLCTDGDFNVGVSSIKGLEDLVEKKRESGVFLSVLGFGTGNIKDDKMETLADKGNGNYAYIDSLMEAKKVLVNEMSGTLYTIAKDVKIQVEFNPVVIQEYRLVGYDNRRLKDEDFNDDKKDAGEVGAGHQITVFYEIIPQGTLASAVDELRYQDNDADATISMDDDKEWMWVKMRYKHPEEDESKRVDIYVTNEAYVEKPDSEFLFATAVAEYALLLKDSEYKGYADFDSLIERARENRGADDDGYRSQFVQLAEIAQLMMEE